MNQTPTRQIKIIVQGSGAVGKSVLTVRYVCDKFLTEYDPTVSDVYSKEISIGDEPYVLNIIDCAGGEEWYALALGEVKETNGFLFVYDITRRETFDDLEYYCDAYSREKEVDKKDLLVVVCGNKCDLADQRQVDSSEGKAFAQKYDYLFFETSAKTRENVDNAFMAIASLCVSERKTRSGNCIIC